jgi:mono/diheme cytochrome c family protein
MESNDTYNRGGLIAFIFSMVFSLVFFVYIALFNSGVDLKEVPDEAFSAGAAAFDITKVEKPWEPGEAMVTHGGKIYQNNCASCHGEKGAGDGVAGQAIVPPPRNLIEGKWKKGGTSIALYTTLLEGIPGTSMVAFKHLSKNDRWALVQFIRSITQNAEADDTAKLEEFAKGAN